MCAHVPLQIVMSFLAWELLLLGGGGGGGGVEHELHIKVRMCIAH